MGLAGSSTTYESGAHIQHNYLQAKLRGNVVTDMVKNLPVLVNTEPGNVFTFLLKAQDFFYLNLVFDVDLLALLVAKTTDRLTQTIAEHMRASSTLGSFCNQILATFFPPRIREEFLSKFVLDRFQTATEYLFHFIESVVTAARILGYQASESELTRRLAQNIHPLVCSHLAFVAEPKTIDELYSLATRVQEARAVEERRRSGEEREPVARSQPLKRELRLVNMAMGDSSPSTTRVPKCWNCSGMGHTRRNCPSQPRGVSGHQGNGGGARQ
jgi:hypothetical protein